MTTLNRPDAVSDVTLGYLQYSQSSQLGGSQNTTAPLMNKVHTSTSHVRPTIYEQTERASFPVDVPPGYEPHKLPKILPNGAVPQSNFAQRILGNVRNLLGTQTLTYNQSEPSVDPTKSDCDFGFSSGSSDLARHVVPGSGRDRLSTEPLPSSSPLALSPWFELHLGPEAQAERTMREITKKETIG